MAEETPSSVQGSTSKPSMVGMEDSASLYLTASQGSTINPFEVGVEDRLHLTALSPSVFDKVESTPSSGSMEFRWSIDQMAILHPADIPMEEVSRQHDTLHLTHDRDVEEKAQRAINQFFSQSVVVPSPWTGSSPRRKTRMTGQQGVTEGADKQSSFIETRAKEGTAHASCQTLLTLPPDFNLEAILGPEYFSTPQSVPEDQEQEVLSTSSLRRKLFFQGDLSTPFSPVKSSSPKCKKGGGQSIYSPPLSPVNRAASTCPPHVRSSPLLKTPSSGSQFSSSPIILSKMTPSNRLTTTPKPSRSSIIPVSMGTPAISPIGKSIFRTPSSSDRDVSVFTIPPTPSCRRPLVKGTPSPCSHARLSAMTTPNLSPIGAVQRHCRPPFNRNNSSASTSPRESTARRGSHVLSLSFADEDKPQHEGTVSCQPVPIGCPEVHGGHQLLSLPESQSNMEHSCHGNTTEEELLANGILETVSDGGFCGERANRKYPDHYYCDFNIVPPGSEVNHDCSQMQVDSGINCQTSSSMEVEGAETEKENLRNVSRRLLTATKCQLESVPENVSMEVMDEDKMVDMVKDSQGQTDCDSGTGVFCRKQPLVECSNVQEDFHNR